MKCIMGLHDVFPSFTSGQKTIMGILTLFMGDQSCTLNVGHTFVDPIERLVACRDILKGEELLCFIPNGLDEMRYIGHTWNKETNQLEHTSTGKYKWHGNTYQHKSRTVCAPEEVDTTTAVANDLVPPEDIIREVDNLEPEFPVRIVEMKKKRFGKGFGVIATRTSCQRGMNKN